MSVRLALKGFQVTVIEQSTGPGGKIAELARDGFRFDMGPSLFTLPELVTDLITEAGEDPGEIFRFRKLDVVTRYFYEDGSDITAYSDPKRFALEIEKKTNDGAEKVLRYLGKSRELFDLTSEVFINSSLHDISNYFTAPYLRAYSKVHKLNAFKTMNEVNASWFNDDRVVRLFNRFATYNGSNPYSAPATLNVIPHLEQNLGAYFPEKGMYGIVEAIYALARKLGVEFLFNTRAERLVTENGRATALKTDAGDFGGEIVVSGIDVHSFYKNIYSDPKRLRKIERQERSTSALIFYWGIDREFPDLDMHNILFSRNYRKEFDHLFTKKTISDDPTIYIFISKKMIPSDAPEGKENWFVMVNVPENIGQDWDEMIRNARVSIMQKISRMLGVDVGSMILFEEVLDPRLIESRTSSFRGSLYGSSSNDRFSAFRRHPNFSRPVDGLYFTGGSVHPGGGIPLCLSSAAIVDQLISKKL